MQMKRIGKQESKQAEIRRKLAQSSITKAEDYEEIISNLVGQRERLESDLHVLREKVVTLQEKQARKQLRLNRAEGATRQRKKGSGANISVRDELAKKYEELKQWQKRSNKTMKNTAVQAEYRAYLDQLFSLEQQIQTNYKKYNDQKATHTRLKKALKQLDRQQQTNNQLQSGIQHENYQLRKRIASIRRIVDRQMNKELDLQNYLIDMRDREREVVEREREIRREKSVLRREKSQLRKYGVENQKSKSVQNNNRVVRHRTQTAQGIVRAYKEQSSSSSSQPSEASLTIAPGQHLTEDEIFQLEGYLNRLQNRYRHQLSKTQKHLSHNYPNQALNQKREGSKLTFRKEIQLLTDRIKNMLNVYHELNEHKIGKYLQRLSGIEGKNQGGYSSTSLAVSHEQKDGYLSKTKSARKLKHIIQEQFKTQEKIMLPRIFNEYQVQTEPVQFYDLEPLRREFTGTFADHQADDRNLLTHQKNSTIRTLNIYYTDRGIASIHAIYNIHTTQASTILGNLCLPQHFCKHFCKIHTIDTEHQDFIRYFKVRYNILENRITSIKTVSNRNIKGGFSEHKKGEEHDPQIQKDWIFDIDQDEFPVSIFVSHVQKGPYWYLSGLGVEISNL